MNPLTASIHQRGASALTLLGVLLIVAGAAGLGFAVFRNESQAPIAPLAASGKSTTVAPSGVSKPAATSTANASAPAKPEAASGGPHLSWYGTWRGGPPAETMVITPTHVAGCDWVGTNEPRFDRDCEAGYTKSSVSQAELVRRFEESVARIQKDPSDFTISDPAQSRALIARVKPGNYRRIWMADGSDCGRGEMIVDGDLLLRVVDCSYRHQVSLFNRIK